MLLNTFKQESKWAHSPKCGTSVLLLSYKWKMKNKWIFKKCALIVVGVKIMYNQMFCMNQFSSVFFGYVINLCYYLINCKDLNHLDLPVLPSRSEVMRCISAERRNNTNSDLFPAEHAERHSSEEWNKRHLRNIGCGCRSTDPVGSVRSMSASSTLWSWLVYSSDRFELFCLQASG